MKKFFSFWFYVLLISTPMLMAQGVAINSSGAAPDASALLDVDASGMSPKAGVLLPRMTLAERNAIPSPATGLLIYCTDDNYFYYYGGSRWFLIAMIDDACSAADETGSGTATANETYSSNSPVHAFDNNTTTLGWGNNNHMPTWLQYDFGAANTKAIDKYTLYRSSSQNGGWNRNDYSPYSWTFEGSNDASTWTVLDTQSNVLLEMNRTKYSFGFTNSTSYRYYRINISAAYSGTWANITEMEMMDCP
jgi:hypothetical protein